MQHQMQTRPFTSTLCKSHFSICNSPICKTDVYLPSTLCIFLCKIHSFFMQIPMHNTHPLDVLYSAFRPQSTTPNADTHTHLIPLSSFTHILFNYSLNYSLIIPTFSKFSHLCIFDLLSLSLSQSLFQWLFIFSTIIIGFLSALEAVHQPALHSLAIFANPRHIIFIHYFV